MEPTNITFEQQLIHTLLQCSLQERRLSDLTDSDVSRIRYFAKKLSEGIEPDGTSKISPDTLLSDLDFSVRTLNVLKRYGIDTVRDLLGCTREDLMKMRLLGRKSYRDILDFLYENNLNLKL